MVRAVVIKRIEKQPPLGNQIVLHTTIKVEIHAHTDR